MSTIGGVSRLGELILPRLKKRFRVTEDANDFADSLVQGIDQAFDLALSIVGVNPADSSS